MDDRRTLAGALRQAARDLDREHPPAAVWAAVKATHAARSAPPRRRAAPARAWFAWSGAAACAVLFVGATLLMLVPPARTPGLASGFVPVVAAERWQQATGEDAWIVPTEMPRERLAALGLPYDPARAGDTVRAELLMQSSGEVLAVRLLR